MSSFRLSLCVFLAVVLAVVLGISTANAAAGADVAARVYLRGADPAGLADYARAVSDPANPAYQHYLDPAQVRQRFGPTEGQLAAVRGWLAARGFAVVEANSHYLSVRAPIATAERAFGTAAGDIEVPAALAGSVLGISSVSSTVAVAQPFDALPPPPPAIVQDGPCSTYFGERQATDAPPAYGHHEPYAVCGYTPAQLRSAYGAAQTGLTGAGQTVAIVDAYNSTTLLADANTYARRHGEPQFRPGQLTQYLPAAYTGTDLCPSDWSSEATMDVQAVHAMAPAANIAYVSASSCQDADLYSALGRIVDTRLATIVSGSWGLLQDTESPSVVAAADLLFEQGAVEGIGFYFASGDCGDENPVTGCGGPRDHSTTAQVNYPAASPWVTSVGGTSLAVGAGGQYQFETGWGTTQAVVSPDGTGWTPGLPGVSVYGAGGGTSTVFGQPFYQRGVVPPALSEAGGSAGRPMRVVPDISAVADATTGLLIGQSQTSPDGSVRYGEYRQGGTSLACPLIAGIQALAQQARHGVPIGFANPAIYERAGTPAYHDVTDHPLGPHTSIAEVRNDYVNGYDAGDGVVTSLRTFGHDTSLAAVLGYDDVTGVGSPTWWYLESFRNR